MPDTVFVCSWKYTDGRLTKCSEESKCSIKCPLKEENVIIDLRAINKAGKRDIEGSRLKVTTVCSSDIKALG